MITQDDCQAFFDITLEQYRDALNNHNVEQAAYWRDELFVWHNRLEKMSNRRKGG